MAQSLKAHRKLASNASAIRQQKAASRSTSPWRYQCKYLVAVEQRPIPKLGLF
jgi:hypothetical protein